MLSSRDLIDATSHRIRRMRRDQELFLWLIPIGIVLALFVLSEKQALELVAAAIALVFFVFLINRPGGTLTALIIFLPAEVIVFSLLYRYHMPGTFLHQASAIKELLALAIVVAGLRVIRDSGQRLDKIDIAVLLYVAVVTIYLAVPHVFSAVAPTQWSPRFLAWRADAGYPLLFFGARHAPFPAKTRERFLQVVMIIGGVVALIGLYQKVAPSSFSNFIINTVRVPNYQNIVLSTTMPVVQRDLAYIYTIKPLHISSILLSPYDLADFMAIIAAIAAVRISRHPRAWFNFAVFGAAMADIFFTQVRADALAIVIVLVFIAVPASRSPVEGRLRLIATILVAAAVVVPALGGSRFFGNKAASQSSTGHIYEIEDGIGVIEYYPLGLGLGQQPGVANRYTQLTGLINGGDISDNVETQVGDELGLQALIPWLAMMILVGWELKRRASRGDELAAAMGFAFLAILIAGQYHHVFLTFPVPWTLWVGVGLALSVTQVDAREGYEYPYEADSYPSTTGVR